MKIFEVFLAFASVVLTAALGFTALVVLVEKTNMSDGEMLTIVAVVAWLVLMWVAS